MQNVADSFIKLCQIVAKLRDPNGGCPWDLKQTHQTLKPYVIEEAYEVVDAIDQQQENPQKLADELGDLLLQVVLHAQLASEAKTFDIQKIVDLISEKLVRRHPHVFGDVKVDGTKQVLENWEAIKQTEKKPEDQKKSIMQDIPKALPALLKAQKIGDKAARIGFDWPNLQGVKEKVAEELLEFSQAKDPTHKAEEMGDLLFALVQACRLMGMNSEDVLNQASEKFMSRFGKMEEMTNYSLAGKPIEQLEALWQKAKR